MTWSRTWGLDRHCVSRVGWGAELEAARERGGLALSSSCVPCSGLDAGPLLQSLFVTGLGLHRCEEGCHTG